MHKAKETSADYRDRFRSSGDLPSGNGQVRSKHDEKTALVNESLNNMTDGCCRSVMPRASSRDRPSVSFATYTGWRSYLDGRHKSKRGRKTANGSLGDISGLKARDQSNNRKEAGKQRYGKLESSHAGCLTHKSLGISSHPVEDSDSCRSLASVRSLPGGPIGGLVDRAVRTCSYYDIPMIKPLRDASDCGYIDATIRPYLHGRVGCRRGGISMSSINPGPESLAGLNNSIIRHGVGIIESKDSSNNNNNSNNYNSNENKNNNNNNNRISSSDSNRNNINKNSNNISSDNSGGRKSFSNHNNNQIKKKNGAQKNEKLLCILSVGHGTGDEFETLIITEVKDEANNKSTKTDFGSKDSTRNHKGNYISEINRQSFIASMRDTKCTNSFCRELFEKNKTLSSTAMEKVSSKAKLGKTAIVSTPISAWLRFSNSRKLTDIGWFGENGIKSRDFYKCLWRSQRIIETFAFCQGNDSKIHSECSSNIFVHQNSNNNSSRTSNISGSSSSCLSSSFSPSICDKTLSSTISTEIGKEWDAGATLSSTEIDKHRKMSLSSYSSTSISTCTSTHSLTQSARPMCSPSGNLSESCICSITSKNADDTSNSHSMENPMVTLLMLRRSPESRGFNTDSLKYQSRQSIPVWRSRPEGQKDFINKDVAGGQRKIVSTLNKEPSKETQNMGEPTAARCKILPQGMSQYSTRLTTPFDKSNPSTTLTMRGLKQNQKRPERMTNVKGVSNPNPNVLVRASNTKGGDSASYFESQIPSPSPRFTVAFRLNKASELKQITSTVKSVVKETVPTVKATNVVTSVGADCESVEGKGQNASTLGTVQRASSPAKFVTKPQVQTPVKRPRSTLPAQNVSDSPPSKSRRANSLTMRKEASTQHYDFAPAKNKLFRPGREALFMPQRQNQQGRQYPPVKIEYQKNNVSFTNNRLDNISLRNRPNDPYFVKTIETCCAEPKPQTMQWVPCHKGEVNLKDCLRQMKQAATQTAANVKAQRLAAQRKQSIISTAQRFDTLYDSDQLVDQKLTGSDKTKFSRQKDEIQFFSSNERNSENIFTTAGESNQLKIMSSEPGSQVYRPSIPPHRQRCPGLQDQPDGKHKGDGKSVVSGDHDGDQGMVQAQVKMEDFDPSQQKKPSESTLPVGDQGKFRAQVKMEDFDLSQRSFPNQGQEKLSGPIFSYPNAKIQDKTERLLLNHMNFLEADERKTKLLESRGNRRSRIRPPIHGRRFSPDGFGRSHSFAGDTCLAQEPLTFGIPSSSKTGQSKPHNGPVSSNCAQRVKMKTPLEEKEFYPKRTAPPPARPQGFIGKKATEEISAPTVNVVYNAPKTFKSFSGLVTKGWTTPTLATKATLSFLHNDSPARCSDKTVSHKRSVIRKPVIGKLQEKKRFKAETETPKTIQVPLTIAQDTSDVIKISSAPMDELNAHFCNSKASAPPERTNKTRLLKCTKKSAGISQMSLDQVTAADHKEKCIDSMTNERQKHGRSERLPVARKRALSSDQYSFEDRKSDVKCLNKDCVEIRTKDELSSFPQTEEISPDQQPQQQQRHPQEDKTEGQTGKNKEKVDLVQKKLNFQDFKAPNLQNAVSNDTADKVKDPYTVFSSLSYASAILDSSWPPTRTLKVDSFEDIPLFWTKDDAAEGSFEISTQPDQNLNIQTEIRGLLNSLASRRDHVSVTRSIPDLTEESSMEKTKHRCSVIRQYIQDKYVCLRHTSMPCRYFTPAIDYKKKLSEVPSSHNQIQFSSLTVTDDAKVKINGCARESLKLPNSASNLNLKANPISLNSLVSDSMGKNLKVGLITKEKRERNDITITDTAAGEIEDKHCAQETDLGTGPCSRRVLFERAAKTITKESCEPKRAPCAPRALSGLSFSAYDSLISELKTHYLLERLENGHHEESALEEDDDFHSQGDWDDSVLDEETELSLAEILEPPIDGDTGQLTKTEMKGNRCKSSAPSLAKDIDGHLGSDTQADTIKKSNCFQKLSWVLCAATLPKACAQAKPVITCKENNIEMFCKTGVSNECDAKENISFGATQSKIFTDRNPQNPQKSKNSTELSLSTKKDNKADFLKRESVQEKSKDQGTVKNQHNILQETKEGIRDMVCDEAFDCGFNSGLQQKVGDNDPLSKNPKQIISNFTDAATQSELLKDESLSPGLLKQFQDDCTSTDCRYKAESLARSLEAIWSPAFNPSQVPGNLLHDKEFGNVTMLSEHPQHNCVTLARGTGRAVSNVKTTDALEVLPKSPRYTQVNQDITRTMLTLGKHDASKSHKDNEEKENCRPRLTEESTSFHKTGDFQEMKSSSDSSLRVNSVRENLKEVAKKLSGSVKDTVKIFNTLSDGICPLLSKAPNRRSLKTASVPNEEGMRISPNTFTTLETNFKQNRSQPSISSDINISYNKNQIHIGSSPINRRQIYDKCDELHDSSILSATITDINDEIIGWIHEPFQSQDKDQFSKNPQTEPLDLSVKGSNNRNQKSLHRDVEDGILEESSTNKQIAPTRSNIHLEFSSHILTISPSRTNEQRKICRHPLDLKPAATKGGAENERILPLSEAIEVESTKHPGKPQRLENHRSFHRQFQTCRDEGIEDDLSLQIFQPCALETTSYSPLISELVDRSDASKRIVLVCARNHGNYETCARIHYSDRMNHCLKNIISKNLANIYWQLMCRKIWEDIFYGSLSMYNEGDISRETGFYLTAGNSNSKEASKTHLVVTDTSLLQDPLEKRESISKTDPCHAPRSLARNECDAKGNNQEYTMAKSTDRRNLPYLSQNTDHARPSGLGTSNFAYLSQHGKEDVAQPNRTCKTKPVLKCTSHPHLTPVFADEHPKYLTPVSDVQTIPKDGDDSGFACIFSSSGENNSRGQTELGAPLLSPLMTSPGASGRATDPGREPRPAVARPSLVSVESDCSFHSCCSICNSSG